MFNLNNALHELRQRRSRAQQEVETIDKLITGIESLNGAAASHEPSSQPKRIISAASRRKMALAQKARWANLRKKSEPVSTGKTSIPVAAKRTMSASARKKIATAVRARWAKIRAVKKAA